ncbi:MAG: UvrD-helicase domain-containing protein [Ardenticatenia bacterium]|nr:UvrD-helicase domain-containing protein [Ardenticatenia bacterium]
MLDELNPQQRDAVTRMEGPVLVLAGPGSGKTRVLTYRIAYLMKTAGIEPANILGVTFTNKAAREMRARLEQLLGERAQHVTLGTFHATCARILRRHIHHLGYEPDFAIYDADDQRRLVHQIIRELNLNERTYRPTAIHAAISRAKNELISVTAYQKHATAYWEEVVGRVYAAYQERLRASNALDFDDLLLCTVELFRHVPDVLNAYRRRWHFIHVDEFQDTNAVQYELVRLLGETHRNVFVVGDVDQSIYAWRGADYRNVLRFEEDFPDAHVVYLEQNYRSTQTILDVAQAVIAKNPHRKPTRLWTTKGPGPKVVVHEAYDEVDEANFVVREVARLVARGEAQRREIAVMYRTNAQSRPLEEAFVRAAVPYVLVGGTRFYERREIKDLLAYLRVVHNPFDLISLERIINVPPRGIGQRTWLALLGWAEEMGLPVYTALQVLAEHQGQDGAGEEGRSPLLPNVPPPFDRRAERVLTAFFTLLQELIRARRERNVLELLDMIVERTGYELHVRDGSNEGEERWDNVRELRNVAAQYALLPVESGLSTFLEEVALISDADRVDSSRDAVTLMTLHTAKGLEFKVVFIVGMEEGLFPHVRSLDDQEALAEERRLAYVGITRAKERLYLVHTFRRQMWGRSELSEPSRFLRDIPERLIRRPRTRTSRQVPLGLDVGHTLSTARPRHRRDEELAAARQRRQAATRAHKVTLRFKPGERVRHPTFGEGIVITSRPSGEDEEVTVAFVEEGTRRLLASLAKLEKLS